MIFYRQTTTPETGIDLVLRTIFLAGLIPLLSGSLLADDPTGVRLTSALTLTLGNHQVVLNPGTVVQILHQNGNKVVVSFKTSDGSPAITQVPARSFDSVSLQKDLLHNSTQTPRSVTAPPELPPADTAPSISEDAPATNSDPNPQQVRPASSVTFSPEEIALPVPTFTALNGSFYITIHGQLVQVVYSLPMEGQHLAKSASNLIFYGPYPNENTKLTGNIVPDIVTKLGCAVFSFSFTQEGDDLSNPNTAYWTKTSGWFPAVMAARDEIIKEFALERKKLLLMGYSGGGGMVLNLAGAFPDQVEAVASQGANLAPDLKEKNSVSWLIINNRGETNARVTIPFYQRLKELGCSALYCETTPERGRGGYHAPSQEAFDLVYTFLAGILDQRKRVEDGTQDLAKLWPYAADPDPLKRYAVIRTLELDHPQVAGTHFDLLPSAAFASNWCKVCPPLQTVSFLEPGHSIRLHVNFPSTDKPVGVVLYYDKPDYDNIPRQVEDISSLAEHGCMVISPSFGMSPERFAQAATDWTLSQHNLASMPIHLAGYGPEGARFLACMNDQTKLSCKSVTLVSLHDLDVRKDMWDKIKSLSKGCGLYSFFSCQTTAALSPISSLTQDLVTNESRARGCQNLLVYEGDNSDETKIHLEEQALDVIKQTVDTSRGNIISAEPGLWLENLALPDHATVNSEVAIKVHVRDRGVYGQQGTVQLKSYGSVLASAHLSFNFDGDQEITLSYIPTESGQVSLEIVLPSLAEDLPQTNNHLDTNLMVK